MNTIAKSIAPIAAAFIAKKVLAALWPGEPPKDPTQAGTSWTSALAWTAAASAAAGGARLIARAQTGD